MHSGARRGDRNARDTLGVLRGGNRFWHRGERILWRICRQSGRGLRDPFIQIAYRNARLGKVTLLGFQGTQDLSMVASVTLRLETPQYIEITGQRQLSLPEVGGERLHFVDASIRDRQIHAHWIRGQPAPDLLAL